MRVRARAAELQALLKGKPQENKVTLAAGITEDDEVIVGTSEGRQYIRPFMRESITELVAPGDGHAESNIVGHTGLSLLTVGAGRDICERCEAEYRGRPGRAGDAMQERKGVLRWLRQSTRSGT